MFQDEGCFGLTGAPRRCWTPVGIRPVVCARPGRIYASAAVSPHDGLMGSLTLPWVNARSMCIDAGQDTLAAGAKAYRVCLGDFYIIECN